jgi:hypothetical protein
MKNVTLKKTTQDASLAVFEEKSATKGIPHVRLAPTFLSSVNISDRCGGVVQSKEGSKKSESKIKSSKRSHSRGVDRNKVRGNLMLLTSHPL